MVAASLTFDAVVASSGGDYTTPQAADDALDSGAYNLLIKQGTYAGFTVSTNNARIEVEPNTTFTSAVTLSGNNIEMELGTGSDIQGILTLSGDSCCVEGHNGVDTDGLVMSGDSGFFDGGGFASDIDGGTSNHAIDITGVDCIVKNVRCKTTAGSGNSYNGVNIGSTGDRAQVIHVQVLSSDHIGIISFGDDCLILGCFLLGSDSTGVLIFAPRNRVIGNNINDAGVDGINLDSPSDNSVVVGNIVSDQTSNSVLIHLSAENQVVVSNRLDGAVTDNSGTSVVASNDTSAFSGA